MEAPPIPPDETERLHSLRELNVLDTPAEERYDRITRLCSKVFDVSYVEINFIDDHRQWTKSAVGSETFECPKNQSFCAHTMLEDGVTVITDARDDQRFRGNPFVTGAPYIRFYMSHPVHSPDNRPVGTICVFDSEPREEISDEQASMLKDFAALIEGELQRNVEDQKLGELTDRLEEAERQSKIDSLTRLWNRRGIMDFWETERNRAYRDQEPIALVMADLDDFKEVNDTHGHMVGDTVLRAVAERLRMACRDYDLVGRYGGEEFLIVLVNADHQAAREVSRRICEEVSRQPVETDVGDLDVTISVGVAVDQPPDRSDAQDLLDRADKQLYRAKEEGKNRVKISA